MEWIILSLFVGLIAFILLGFQKKGAWRFNKKQLLKLCEMLGKFAQECEWNVAVGQVLGAMAAEWEEIL